MRTLNRYLLDDYLATFALTLAVFTFVMCLGVVIKAIDIAARGVSGVLILKIFALNVPYMMTFSIPMSVLTTVLLLFGRLSFDGELNAMKASGLSMWQIVSVVVMLSIVLSSVCLFINASVAPRARHIFRTMLMEVGVDDPANLLEAGRFVRDFPKLMIYVADRKGNLLKDIVVYEMADDGQPVQNVRALSGQMRVAKEEQAMYIDLNDVRIDRRELDKETGLMKSRYINAGQYPVKLDFSKMQRKTLRKKMSDMTFFDLVSAIRDVRAHFPTLDPQDIERQRMSLVVETNKRLALSLSCFAFTLVGIPLGMKSKRKESSIGVGISLALVFLFYLFIIIANSLVGSPNLRPDLIVWIPVVASEIIGFVLIQKTN